MSGYLPEQQMLHVQKYYFFTLFFTKVLMVAFKKSVSSFIMTSNFHYRFNTSEKKISEKVRKSNKKF